MVGYSGREIRAVAPNSPSEMVKAKVAATNSARPTSGRSIKRTPDDGAAPNTAAAWRRRGLMLLQRRGQAAHHKRECHQGVRQRDQHWRGAQVERRGSSATINPSPSVTAEVPSGSIKQRLEQPALE